MGRQTSLQEARFWSDGCSYLAGRQEDEQEGLHQAEAGSDPVGLSLSWFDAQVRHARANCSLEIRMDR